MSAAVQATVKDLSDRAVLSDRRGYLAGGTALAMRYGHRRSADLDFFSEQGFHSDKLIQGLLGLEGLGVTSQESDTLHVVIRGVKVSFLSYRYPALFAFDRYRGVEVADARDIACMKVTAIAGRGTKRDFVDLHQAAGRLGGLEAIFGLFARKYAAANYSKAHLLKSLTYFHDAEQDPMPDMLVPCDWAEVKSYFAAEAPRLLA